ncbi:MAG: choice-of-anchor B family protein [Rhodothermales bacterium]
MRYGFALCALLLPFVAVAQPVPCENGFAGPYPCSNVDLLSQPTEVGASDIWGWTDPQTGTEYAIFFTGGRTTFYDLSDPTAPVLVGRLAATAGKDARVYADHLFVVDDSGLPGMLVFDLTRLRGVETPPATFEHDAVYTGIERAHNLSLDPTSGFAYPVSFTSRGRNCAGALHIVDVRDPLNPAFAGCFTGTASVMSFHDAHCITYDGPDADYTGRELCFGSAGSDGVLAVVDVTNKSRPALISEAPYPNAAFAHQGWLTEDGRYFLLNDEFDEGSFGINTRTVVFDVSDLDEPEFVFEHFAETMATDHNLFVRGDYVYQANYGAGLRILDLNGIDGGVLTEAAFFDTRPDVDGFSGAWGVYPFFESGIVIVSDMARGLFVLQPRLDPTTDAEPVAEPSEHLALTAYPNPFAGHATVALSVETTQRVHVAVYDVLGREVALLHDDLLGAGEERTLTLNGAGLPAGSYVVRAVGETFEVSRSASLVR